MQQAELTYPNGPGWKSRGTAQQAAFDFREAAGTLQEAVLRALDDFCMTADETAEYLGKSILSIRPRLSELARQGKIIDTGKRRQNASGKSAIVWRAK